MSAAERYGGAALLLALLLALAVRVPSIVYGDPSGRDIVEYDSIARNLLQGEGFQLDIKAYHAHDTPVVHYSGYDRAPLFPVVLAGFKFAIGETYGHRVVSPFLFLFALILIFDLIRKYFSISAAFWVTLLIGLHPGLMELSLLPLSEPLLTFSLAVTLWGALRLRNPWVAGFGVALCFLTRPSSLPAISLVGITFLFPYRGARSLGSLAIFGLTALMGPAMLVGLNIQNDALPFLLPQSFLFRVMDHSHMVHTMNEGRFYPSAGALLAEEGLVVAERIAKHALYYLQALGSAMRGIGALLVLMPLAVWGFLKYGKGRVAGLLFAVGFIDLVFYTLVWSTFDADRFTSVFLVVVASIVILGAFLLLEDVPLRSTSAGSMSTGSAFCGLLGFVWLGASLFSGYLSWSESEGAGPARNPLANLWNRNDSNALVDWMNGDSPEGPGTLSLDQRSLASNVPWLLRHRCDVPGVLLPYDLEQNELEAFFDQCDVGGVVIHTADWPGRHVAGLESLLRYLHTSKSGKLFESHQVQVWKLPEPVRVH